MAPNHTAGPIVVGVDGSKAAITAAVWAIDEAVGHDVPLRLVHVIDSTDRLSGRRGDAGLEMQRAQQTLRAADTAVEAVGTSVKVDTAIRAGDVDATLVEESRAAAMICVGSVGIGRLARRLLGSTATGLATKAHCPAAIIRSSNGLPSTGGRIAVVVDAEPGNDAVVQVALAEGRLRKAPVLALGGWRWDLGSMPYDELDQRVSKWLPRYPDVQVSLCAARSGVVPYLAHEDAILQLVIIGDANAEKVARLVGPRGHPLFAHPDCSVLVVHPHRHWSGGPQWFGN